MKTVGVRDLKNQLSLYLRLVKNGEVVLITEHRKVIAELSLPQENSPKNPIEIDKYIQEKEKEGRIIKAKRNKSLIMTDNTDKISIDWKVIYNETRNDRN
jgi:antitoxin (DNA-binding transcriptional repressor) of toxin-antitoxin stability system